MIHVYRITKRKHSGTAFTGIGSVHAAQRWNSIGIPVVYAASSLSLATLELIVQPNNFESFAEEDYVYYEVVIDPVLISSVKDLPETWRATPASEATRVIGDKWFKERTSLALKVPSAVIPQEINYMINPLHEDFKKLIIPKPQAFEFDHRLINR